MAVIDPHGSHCVTRKAAFWRLWILGLAGAVAAAAEPLPSALLASSGFSEGFVRAVTFANSSLLLAAMVGVGVIATPIVGLRAHLAPLVPAAILHKGQAFHWVQAGILVGFALVAGRVAVDLWIAAQIPISDAAFMRTAEEITSSSLSTQLLFDAVTQELMLRWGLMSGVLWVLFLIWGGEERAEPSARLAWAAIIISSVLVFIGEVPGFVMIGLGDPASQLLLLNGVISAVTGVAFGWLFWRHGLEAAILAHIIMTVGLSGVLTSGPMA